MLSGEILSWLLFIVVLLWGLDIEFRMIVILNIDNLWAFLVG